MINLTVSWPRSYRTILPNVVFYLISFLVAGIVGVLTAVSVYWLAALLLLPVFLVGAWQFPDIRQPPYGVLTLLLLVFIGLFFLWPPYVVWKAGPLPALNPQRFVYVLLIGLWIFSLLASKEFTRTLWRKIIINRFPVLILAGLLFLKFLSIFVSNAPWASLFGFGNEMINFFLVFFMIISFIRSTSDIEKIFIVLVVAGLIVCILGVIERYLGHNLFQWLPMTTEYQQYAVAGNVRGGSYRVQSTAWHPILLSEFLAFVLPIAIYTVLYAVKKIVRILALGLLVLMPLVLYSTGSRSALIAVAVIVVFVAGFSVIRTLRFSRSFKATALIAAGAPLIIFVIFLSIPFLFELAEGRTAQEYASSGYRLIMLELGIPVVMSQPLLGYGVGRAAVELGFSDINGKLLIDNYYLQIAIESGIPSLLLYVGLLSYFLMMGSVMGLKSPKKDAVMAGVITASIAVFPVMNLIMAETQYYPLLFLGFAMLAVLREQARFHGDGTLSVKKESG